MTHSPPSYFCSIPATDIWYPVAPGTTTLPAAPTPTVNASPVPVNAAELPEDWDPAAPDLCYLFQDILSASAPAVFPLVVTPGSILPPYSETVTVLAVTRTRLVVRTVPYALVLPPVDAALATRTGLVAGLLNEVILRTRTRITAVPPSYTRVTGTVAPILGAGQADVSAATAAGWTVLFNDTADEGDVASSTFAFSVDISTGSFNGCYIASNQYLTFGGSSVAYESLSATIPAIIKLHLGSQDLSYQRAYQKDEAFVSRIRWEGNSAYDAVAGSSNRFLEVAFFKPKDDGTTYIEVRSGNIVGGTSGPFMLASTSAALASDTFVANESWVFEGTGDGTSWALAAGSHVEITY